MTNQNTVPNQILDDIERTLPSADDAIASVVNADGNLQLAALRLHIDESSLLQALVTDRVALDRLINQLRARIMVRHYRTLVLTMEDLMKSLELMKPSDKIRFYQITNETLTKLMGEPSDTLETLLGGIPEGPRKALLEIMGTRE